MMDLRQCVNEYLALRRSLGFKLLQHGRLLTDFVDSLDHAGAPAPTTPLALAWATRPENAQPLWWKKRLSVVSGFCRYLHTLDPSVEVPAPDLLAYRYQRPVPYLYSENEIGALVDVAATLSPSFRAATYGTLFGVLASTGMRLCEAIHLDRADFDHDKGLVRIRQTKFKKSRVLPLHPSTADALRGYVLQRDRLNVKAKGSSLFLSTRGTRLLDACVHRVFTLLSARIGLGPRAGSGCPRIHDLRHTFAVATLRDWYRAEVDVNSKLPLLSAYLGHVDPVSTYWYLQAAPDLLALAAERIKYLRRL